jgi:nicotinate-nucleotide pyrophosphorylase (carboxylating)
MEFASENLDGIIDLALQEDIGDGDLTTLACVSPDIEGQADVMCKSDGVLSGQTVAQQVFRKVDERIRYAPLITDGSRLRANTIVASVTGKLASLLTAERVALNFLMRMSGIATLTERFVREVTGTGVAVLDTRKTTPGLRELEKYAVLCGGGVNHRMGLYDMILIKDNHIRAAGSVSEALKKCLDYTEETGCEVPVEIEVDSGTELEQALDSGAARIMLDNMNTAQVKEAVERIHRVSGDIKIEISGGVTLANIRDLAECGVDYISVGALTHSAPSLDFSLNITNIA